MKKLKAIFLILLIFTLIFGLAYRAFDRVSKTESTEFLFDTYCTVTAYSKDADAAVSAVFDELSRIHSLTNFFDENSDVSKINRAANGEKVKVDPCVINIISKAQEIKLASDGAFDISIAPASMLWKFDENAPTPPTDEQINQALLSVGNSGLTVDVAEMTVSKVLDTAMIDLGGVAKGYAGDVALKILREYGVEAAIVDLGGNILCYGKNPNSKDGKWRIGLQKPFAPTGEYSNTVQLTEGAVVTSGTYQRYFEHEGEVYHHIIDPKTGRPARQSYQSVTVVAESSMEADCLATAVYVLGREQGETLARSRGAEVYFK